MGEQQRVKRLEKSSATSKTILFGRALDEALTIRGLTQTEVATRLGTTQSTVSAWKRGQCEPDMDTVFALEELLGLRPGHLSRHLGYLPVTVEIALPTVEDTISRSDLADDVGKKLTLMCWQTMKTQHAAYLQVAAPAGTTRPAKITTGKKGSARAAQDLTIAEAKAADTGNAAVLAAKKATRRTPPRSRALPERAAGQQQT